MKTSQLMLGELVMFYGRVSRIDGLWQDIAHVEGEPEEQYAYMQEIEPIPLTAEILEANGFTFSEGYASIYDEYEEGLFSISITKTGFWLPISFYGKGLRVEYVHELQHALRLCGLNQIADNFKI